MCPRVCGSGGIMAGQDAVELVNEFCLQVV